MRRPFVITKGNEWLTKQAYCRKFVGQLRGWQDDIPKVCEHQEVELIGWEREWLSLLRRIWNNGVQLDVTSRMNQTLPQPLSGIGLYPSVYRGGRVTQH